mmetsp:Transcript_26308/g.77783  ORF Transcript_26308/g.77783 Transcript_26308/m.77783 type:complete len:1519 (-) Transcript_26308:88-4644(-)
MSNCLCPNKNRNAVTGCVGCCHVRTISSVPDLDRIITQIVKPQVSVYMAIDGVAPRAKLNQQRSRRFRSAKDLAEATKDKIISSQGDDGGDGSSHSGAFDSNCITPGTEFMARVSATIKYFIRKKIKEDPYWRKLKIIFSGQEIPGEGEHKIMQHIRDMRNQPGYRPNTRHCMYGQDADLIMLGLVSHEPHFTLLREIVDFSGGFDRNVNALKTVKKFTKQSDFQLLHLSVLREYLQIEFAYGLDPKSYDLEAIIDDFVFMTFLVGNDFLPHMPSLDIGDGAFDLLFDTYKQQRPGWGEGQYLTHAGEVPDAKRLEQFIAVIGAAETEIFEQREENEAVYLKKKRRWDKRDGRPEGLSDAQLAAQEESKQLDYLTMIEDMMSKHSIGGEYVDGRTPPSNPGQKDFKGRYYYEKLHITPIDVNEHLALRQCYIEGLLWCLAYYYRGCISWGWFYPYHYGPMLSDLTNLTEVFSNIRFDLGAPLKPFEQLMGCLPPASAACVPRPYRKLMCSPDSPILQFYPESFEVDMNGKRNPWEGVNILPFIDVHLLKDTIAKECPDKVLTADELTRNRIGKVFCYTYDGAVNDTVPSCNKDIGLPDITKCNSRVDILEEPDQEDVSFKPELVPGTQIPYPGFPSLNVLPIASSELLPMGLNCFGMPSKYPNTFLTLHKMPQLPDATELADNVLGKSLFVNWPMMHEGKVVAVSDATCEVRTVKKKKKVKKFTKAEAERWESDTTTMGQQYLNGAGVPGSGGVDIGSIQIRLKLVPLQGMKTSPVNGSTKKVFGKEEADVPLQMGLWKAPAPDPRFIERGPMTLTDRFPSGCRVLLTKGKHRGCHGEVLGVVDGDKIGVKVQVIPPEPPFGLAIARSVQESYISSGDAARVLKIDPRIFGKITGSAFFEPGRYDLGLNLKYRENLCVLGYTRQKQTGPKQGAGKPGKKENAWKSGDAVLVVGSKRSALTGSDDDEDGRVIWEFTPKAVRLVAAYKQKFPQLFAALAKNVNERKYNAKRVLGPKGNELLPKIREWLNNVETAKIPRLPCTTQAMPFAAISAVQRAADIRIAAREKEGPLKEVNIKIPSSALYREGSTSATDVLIASILNENASPELGDRVANLCANGVPFGARGTVVSIHDPAEGCVEVVMDEEFIGGSTLQGSCASFRGKLCVWNHLLKISATDSQGVVDQLIPAGSVKAAIDSAVGVKEEKTYRSATPKQISSSYETAAVSYAAASQENQSGKRNDIVGKSPLPTRSMTPSKVTGNQKACPPSGGRGGKQGFWREAKGPDGAGIGFRGVRRGAKNGFQAWRSLLTSDKQAERKETDREAMAGNGTGSAASAGLKAILGVKPEARPENEFETRNAAAGLKAMLGVGTVPMAAPSLENVPLPPPPPSIPKPATAADALFEMMMNEGPAPVAPAGSTQQPQPGFNFTYVKEGEEAPAPQQHGTANINYGRGTVPGPPILPGHMYPEMMQPQMMPMMTSNAYTPAPQGGHQTTAGKVKREKKPNTRSEIVPSVVAAKSKK